MSGRLGGAQVSPTCCFTPAMAHAVAAALAVEGSGVPSSCSEEQVTQPIHTGSSCCPEQFLTSGRQEMGKGLLFSAPRILLGPVVFISPLHSFSLSGLTPRTKCSFCVFIIFLFYFILFSCMCLHFFPDTLPFSPHSSFSGIIFTKEALAHQFS